MFHLRLHNLRKLKNLSRSRLAALSNVSVRTIQRLENAAWDNTTPRGNTVERLAKALQVEPGVLTGELPLPDSGKAPATEPQRVQIGAEIAPKARLAYDLVKRRYGVSATEIINMAPLFFTLLAEGSLAKRRDKLVEAREAISRLDQMEDEVGHRLFGGATTVALNADMLEEASIRRADLFGEHLFSDTGGTFVDEPFDPGTGNPFASYLRTLTADLDHAGVVDVERNTLSYGAPWLKFPDYGICGDELDGLTHGCPNARRALETGCTRLSAIPDELMAEDAGEKRAAWLEERLPNIFKDLEEGQPMAGILKFQTTATPTEMKELVETTGSEPRIPSRGTEEQGDDR